VTRAFTEGVRRVLSAPAVLIGVAAAAVSSPLYPNAASRRVLIEFVLVGSFLLGGVIDRYARARPTRAYGFFGACGMHAGAMLRLAVAELLLYLVADNLPDARAALALALAVNLVGVYARVRLVVEDRRSALGAALAAIRFIRRRPLGCVAIYACWTAAMAALAMVARAAAPIVLLPELATATVFFQSALAHVNYTAAPPLQWPESPAAEAIVNHR
jgi:hypothetical protein